MKISIKTLTVSIYPKITQNYLKGDLRPKKQICLEWSILIVKQNGIKKRKHIHVSPN